MKTSVQRIRVGSGRENVRAGDPRILIFPRDFKGLLKIVTFLSKRSLIKVSYSESYLRCAKSDVIHVKSWNPESRATRITL